MRKTLLAMAILGTLGLPVLADVTKEDLKRLGAAGISEDIILSYMKTNAPVVNLSADDLVELKKAGLTNRVLAAATVQGASPQGPSNPLRVPDQVAVAPPAPDAYYPPTTAYAYDYYSSPARPYLYSGYSSVYPYRSYSSYDVHRPSASVHAGSVLRHASPVAPSVRHGTVPSGASHFGARSHAGANHRGGSRR